MTQTELSNFIWSVADLIRGPYRPPQYERVMLPLMGTLDLRSLLAERAEREWYLATPVGSLDEPLSLEPQAAPLTSSPHLPDPGFVLHDQAPTDETVREVRAIDGARACLTGVCRGRV